MKTFKEFGMSLIGEGTIIRTTKIVAETKHNVYRDGGSHGHKVLNSEDCGFCDVIQDFSIGSEKRGTRGQWYLHPNPPKHTEKIPVDLADVEFV